MERDNNNYRGINYNNINNNNNSNNNNLFTSNNGYNDYELKVQNYGNNVNDKEKNKISFSFTKLIVIIIFLLIVAFGVYIFLNISKSYDVTIHLNGADEIKEKDITCKSNIIGRCYVSLPIVKRNNGDVLGYSLNKNSTVAEYKVGDKIEITEDTDLYVISKEKYKLVIDKTDIDEVNEEKISCEVYNDNKSCQVNIPMFNKLGNKPLGYALKKNDSNNIIYQGSEYELTDNTNLYPIYRLYTNFNGNAKIVTNRSIYKYNTYLEIGNGCSMSDADSLSNNLDRLYNNWPFYAYYGKALFLDDDNFFNLYGMRNSNLSNGLQGFTLQYDLNNPVAVVRCNSGQDHYLSMVHELSHALDARYKDHFGKYICDEEDVISLYNKYVNGLNRPLRDYAYYEYNDGEDGKKQEFFAEIMAYYYINYVDSSYNIKYIYKRGNYPDDMKKVAEKYLCIAKNNFDKSKCN